MAQLGLQARLGPDLELREGGRDLVVLRVVLAETVGVVAAIAGAEGELVVDARDDAFAREGAVLGRQQAALDVHLVAVEERVELVEGERAGPLRTDQEQVALAERGLDRRGVERLQHLRLVELAHARDLVARQRRVVVREQPVRRVVARIDVHRVPALHEADVLEAEVGVDTTEACAARGEIRIEQQPRAVDRPVVVQLDRLLRPRASTGGWSSAGDRVVQVRHRVRGRSSRSYSRATGVSRFCQ